MNDSMEYENTDVKRQRESRDHASGKRCERQKIKRKHDNSENHAFMDVSRTIIMDNGAYTIKAELASRNEPLLVIIHALIYL